MEFQVKVPDTEESWESRAVLKNISQGGLYFECETVPQLKRGNVAEFTFTTTPAKYSFINSPISAQAVGQTHRTPGGWIGQLRGGRAVRVGPAFRLRPHKKIEIKRGR